MLNYFPQWHADFENGWAYTEPEYIPFLRTAYPEDPTGPDELIEDHWLWPTHKVVPFHMQHPVTGEAMVPQAALAGRSDALSRRIPSEEASA